MIVVGGDGSALFLLLFLAAFLLVPFLLVRSAARGLGAFGGGYPVQRSGALGSRRAQLGWQAWPAQGQQGWAVPEEPVLPPVDAADVRSLRDRLGHDVATLEPGDDAVSRQAMADASERFATCGTLLERAGSSQAQLRTAWLTAVEGLTATRLVRTRLGLDPGPEIPLPPSPAPVLQSPVSVDVDGRRYTGSPDYRPGSPHWFPGGWYGGNPVPRGWYDAPFWPSGTVLGGLGGLALGAMVAGSVFSDGDWADSGWTEAGWSGGDAGWSGWSDGGLADGGGFGDFGGGGDW